MLQSELLNSYSSRRRCCCIYSSREPPCYKREVLHYKKKTVELLYNNTVQRAVGLQQESSIYQHPRLPAPPRVSLSAGKAAYSETKNDYGVKKQQRLPRRRPRFLQGPPNAQTVLPAAIKTGHIKWTHQMGSAKRREGQTQRAGKRETFGLVCAG